MEIDTQSVWRGVINRSRAAWYCYLMYGFFMYLLTIQGNIIPFLKSELHLSYGTVSLHSSAFAAPGIVTGVFGDWLIRRYGRRRALWLGVSGMSAGAVLLCVSSAPRASIGSCALMGALGGLIWIVVTAVLGELYGDNRNVAYSEASAVAYAFGVVAPLMASLCLLLTATAPHSKNNSDSRFFAGVHLGMDIKQAIDYYKKLGNVGAMRHSGAPVGQEEVDFRNDTVPQRRVYIDYRKSDGRVLSVIYWKLGEDETFSNEELQAIIRLNSGNGPLTTKLVDKSEFLVTTPKEYRIQQGE